MPPRQLASQLTWGTDNGSQSLSLSSTNTLIDLRDEATERVHGETGQVVDLRERTSVSSPTLALPLWWRGLLLGITISLGITILTDSLSSLRVFLALAFLTSVPGGVALARLRNASSMTAIALSIGLSLAISGCLASAMLWSRQWHPLAAYYAVSMAACVVVIPTLRQYHLRPFKPSVNRTVILSVVGPFFAMVAWLDAVTRIDVGNLSDHGLVAAFPISYFLAIAIVVASFFYVMAKSRPEWVLATHIIVLIVIFHATAAVVYSAPRYAWTYKHVGVADYFLQHHTTNTSLDIYNNWPTFFAFSAWLTKIGGQSLTYWAQWSQLFFNLCDFIMLWLLYTNLTKSKRIVWVALALFFCGSWVGQDYFAPQAYAYTLSIAFFCLVIPFLHSPSGLLDRPTKFVRNNIKFMRQRLVSKTLDASGIRRALTAFPLTSTSIRHNSCAPVKQALSSNYALIVALFLAFAIVASHQLTPALLFAQVLVLTLCRHIRKWWFVIILGVIDALYIIPHLHYVLQHFELFSTSGATYSESTGENLKNAMPGRVLSMQAARLITAILAMLALVGLVRRLRSNRFDLTYALLAVAPFGIIAGQDYGGEGIMRAYIMSLPWLAFLGAYAFAKSGVPFVRRYVLPAGATVTSVVLISLFLPAYFGNDGANQIRKEEVAASIWALKNVPSDGTVYTVNEGFPSRAVGDYARIQGKEGGDSAPSIATYLRYASPPPTSIDDWSLDAFLKRAQNAKWNTCYLVFSDSQEKWSQIVGIPTIQQYRHLRDSSFSSPRATVVYRQGNATVLAITK